VRRITTRIFLAYLTVALTLAVVAPALGAVDLPAIRNLIWGVVDNAWAQNQAILDQFTTDAYLATTKTELDTARNRAHGNLDAVWDDSIALLDGYLALSPDELAGDVAAAKAQLLADHDGAHAEVDALYELVVDSLPSGTTTTTTPPPTTTTTPKSTTTTTTSVTTTTRPTTTTTTSVTTTTRPTTTTTSTVTTTTRPTTTTTSQPSPAGVVAPSQPGGGAGGSTSDVVDDAVGGGLVDDASPVFSATSADDQAHIDAMVESSMHGMVSMMLSSGASVVLPDRIAQVAVAPIVLIEMLIATLFESVRDLIIPLTMLIIAVAVFVWRETRRGARAVVQPPM
jgi:hypothetical protein